MSTLHSRKAASALKNVEKITRHDQTFWLMRGKRDLMEYKLPEWESLREHASEIKRHTATHLDLYLEQFSKNLENNGEETGEKQVDAYRRMRVEPLFGGSGHPCG